MLRRNMTRWRSNTTATMPAVPPNSYYERPATEALLGDVNGKRVLEVGCGTGPVPESLADHGAEVVACDVSAAMLEIARSRVGDSAELHHHDLAEPLTFLEDANVDLVVASLVFHNLHDWVGPLPELHGILRPTGSVVMSGQATYGDLLASPPYRGHRRRQSGGIPPRSPR